LPGVITRVCTLFTGHNELCLGFNVFLPDDKKLKRSNKRANARAVSGVSTAGSAQYGSSAPQSAQATHASPQKKVPLLKDALAYINQVCTRGANRCFAV
jgi:histone deacetylase complex regulatory component SIN3